MAEEEKGSSKRELSDGEAGDPPAEAEAKRQRQLDFREKVKIATAHLPRISDGKTIFRSWGWMRLVAASNFTVVPSELRYICPPEGFGFEDPNNTDTLTFEGQALASKTVKMIKVMCYALSHGCDIIVSANDGYVMARSVRFLGEVAYGHDRAFEAKQPASLNPLLAEIARVMEGEDVRLSRSSIGNLIKHVVALSKVPRAAIEGLIGILAQLTAGNDEVANWIAGKNMPEGYGELKNVTLAIFDIMLTASMSSVPLDDVIDTLFASEMDSSQKKGVLASHPTFKLPMPTNNKDSFVDAEGQPALRKSISELSDDDSVLCTGRYTTVAGMNPLRNDTKVYTHVVFPLVAQKKSKEKAKADKPISGSLLPARVFKYVVTLNAKQERRRAGVSDASQSTGADDKLEVDLLSNE